MGHGETVTAPGHTAEKWSVWSSTQFHRTPRPSWNLTEFHITVEGTAASDHHLVSGGTRIGPPCCCFHPTATPPRWSSLESVQNGRQTWKGCTTPGSLTREGRPRQGALQTSGVGGFQVLATGTPKSMGFNFFNRGYLLLRATRSPQG